MIRVFARHMNGAFTLLLIAGSFATPYPLWACPEDEKSLEQTVSALVTSSESSGTALVQGTRWQSGTAAPRSLPPEALARLAPLQQANRWVEMGMLYREYGLRDLALPIEAEGRARFDALVDHPSIVSRQIGGAEGSGSVFVGYQLTFPDGQQGYFKPDGPHQEPGWQYHRLADAEVSSYHVSEGYAPLGLVPYTRIFTWRGMRGSLQYFVSDLTNMFAARQSGTRFSERANARATLHMILTGNFDWRDMNQAFVNPPLSPDHVISHDNGLNFSENIAGPEIFLHWRVSYQMSRRIEAAIQRLGDLPRATWHQSLSQNGIPEHLVPRIIQRARARHPNSDIEAEVYSEVSARYRQEIGLVPMSDWQTTLSRYIHPEDAKDIIDTVDRQLIGLSEHLDLMKILVDFTTPEGIERFNRMTPLLSPHQRLEALWRVSDIISYMRQRRMIPPAEVAPVPASPTQNPS